MKQELNLSIVGDWKSPRAPNTWLCYGGWRRSEDGERSALSAAFFGPDLPLAQPDVEGAVLASQDGGRSWRQMASVQGSVVVWAGLISDPAEEADAFAYLSAVGDLHFSTTQDRQLIGDLSPGHAWSKKNLGIQWDRQLKLNVYDCNLNKATVLVGSSQMGPRHAYRIDIKTSTEREGEWLVEASRVPDFLAACESDSSLTLLSSVQGQEYPHRRGIELRALHVETLEEHFSMALDWPLRWGRRATGDRYLFSVGDFLAVLGPDGSLRITR